MRLNAFFGSGELIVEICQAELGLSEQLEVWVDHHVGVEVVIFLFRHHILPHLAEASRPLLSAYVADELDEWRRAVEETDH